MLTTGLFAMPTTALLAGTGVLLFLSVVVAARTRHAALRVPSAAANLDVHDLALLAGGPSRVVVTALVELRRQRLVRVDGRVLHAAGSLRAGADPVEAAVLASLPVDGGDARGLLPGSPLLGDRVDRLQSLGLLFTPAAQHRARRAPLWLLPSLLLLGVLLIARVLGDQPLLPSLLLLGVGLLCLRLLGRRVPRRTPQGTRMLRDARRTRAQAFGGVSGFRRLGGPPAVALFGPQALRQADPELAACLRGPRTGRGDDSSLHAATGTSWNDDRDRGGWDDGRDSSGSSNNGWGGDGGSGGD